MASEVIKLNLIPKGEMPVFHASQFDTGRLITCELYRGEDAYSVPEGYTVELHCRKVDNNIVTMASTLINDNVVTFTSTEQLTACNGKNLCEVAILDEGYRIGTLNFILEVEVDPLKGGINSTSEIHNLESQIEDITTEIIGENYYDKSEVDTLLADKADADSVYTKTETDAKLALKANASSVYTKSETDTLLLTKADASDVYTKAQVETKLALKANVADVYTKAQTDSLLSSKADISYVDAEVDDLETAISAKANASDVYTKTQVDTALALKANAADVYTKAETDAKIEEAIEEILPVDTAGPSAIANFTTALALPLVNCSVGITATGGNGTPDNPNPINGYTEANITANGNTVTIAFGQTVYGSVLDVTRGKLHVTHGIAVFDGTEVYSNYFPTVVCEKQFTKGSGTPVDMVCSHAPNVALPNQWFGYANINNIKFEFRKVGDNWGCADIDAFKTFIATQYANGTPVQICYPLDTPFDIDLTPEVISSVVGTNNVYSDTNGDTTVKFKDTIQNYIDKKVIT